MRRSKRLNVVESSDAYANESPIGDETQALVQDGNQCEHQGDDDLHMSGEDVEVNTRGPTTLPYVWDLAPGKRIVVKCNRHGQPIGREGGVLGQFLGTIARNGGYCPLDKMDWRQVKKNDGDKTILQFVQSKFLYPLSCEKWILKSIGRDWKQYKAKLKKSLFNPKKKKPVLYKRCPDDVDEGQWRKLVKHWKSEKGKVVSEKNKMARAMRKTTHRAGTNSYARWAEEMRQNDPEKKHPHRAKVYLATHKDKSNQRDENVAELENLIDDQPELAKNDKGRVAWKGDALHKVLGEEKPGQVHGMGLLPVPKQVYGWTPHHLKSINITTEDGPSFEVDIDIMKKMENLEEHNRKQDQLIQDLLNKQTCTCHGNRETDQDYFQTTHRDNFQTHSIHSRRKRVECNLTDQDLSLTDQQEILSNKEKCADRDNMHDDHSIFFSKKQHEHFNRKELPHQEEESSFVQDFPHEKLQRNNKQKQQDNTDKRKDQVNRNKIPQRVTSRESCPSIMEAGTTVVLMSMNKKTMAFATFLSCDPDAQVGGVRLGNQFQKVRVNYPIDETMELIRPWGHYKTLGDAKGKSIAWPSAWVEKVNG